MLKDSAPPPPHHRALGQGCEGFALRHELCCVVCACEPDLPAVVSHGALALIGNARSHDKWWTSLTLYWGVCVTGLRLVCQLLAEER